jgi:hypothetical protein
MARGGDDHGSEYGSLVRSISSSILAPSYHQSSISKDKIDRYCSQCRYSVSVKLLMTMII